jgi:predicted nucleotidyltransferase
MSLWCGMMTPPVQLERIAHIFSEWAEPLPLERVFVFGSYARGDATAKSDLDVAIKFDEQNLTHERLDAWLRENKTDFADLKKALGIPLLHLHAERFDSAWPAIEAAARNPVLVVGKVIVAPTPKR